MADVDINLRLEVQELKAKLTAVQQQLNKLGENAKQAGDKATTGVKKINKEATIGDKIFQKFGRTMAATFATGAIIAFTKATIRAYDEAAKGEAKLLNALNGRKDVQERLLAQARDIQKRTVIQDDAIVAMQAFAAAQGRSEQQTKALIEAAIQLSAVTGDDLQTAVMKLDATLEGNIGRLGKLDSEFKKLTIEQLKNGEAVDLVNKKYKGFAETAAKEGIGPWQQLANQFNDLMEQMGKSIATSGFGNFMKESMSNLTGWLQYWYDKQGYIDNAQKEKQYNQQKMYESMSKAELQKYLDEYNIKFRQAYDKGEEDTANFYFTQVEMIEKILNPAVKKTEATYEGLTATIAGLEATLLEQIAAGDKAGAESTAAVLMQNKAKLKAYQDEAKALTDIAEKKTRIEIIDEKLAELTKKQNEYAATANVKMLETTSRHIMKLEEEKMHIVSLAEAWNSINTIDFKKFEGELSKILQLAKNVTGEKPGQDIAEQIMPDTMQLRTAWQNAIKPIEEEEFNIWESIFGEDNAEKGKEYTNQVIGEINSVVAAYVTANQKIVESYDKRISEQQQALQTELQLQEQGYANNVTVEQKKLAELKKQRDQALEEQKKAMRLQLAFESAQQAAGIGTAVVNIFKDGSKFGILGILASVAAIASMFALIAKFKAQASAISKMESGGLLKGLSHAGGGIPIMGTGVEVEGGEYVVNKKSTGKYLPLIDAINKGNDNLVTRQMIGMLSGKMSHTVSLDEGKNIKEMASNIKRMANGSQIIQGRGYYIEKTGNKTRKVYTN